MFIELLKVSVKNSCSRAFPVVARLCRIDELNLWLPRTCLGMGIRTFKSSALNHSATSSPQRNRTGDERDLVGKKERPRPLLFSPVAACKNRRFFFIIRVKALESRPHALPKLIFFLLFTFLFRDYDDHIWLLLTLTLNYSQYISVELAAF